MSDKTEIYKALVNFQSQNHNITLNKEVNVGKYKYRYADLSEIWEKIRPHLKENKLAVIQPIEGNVLKTILIHESGCKIESSIELSPNKDIQKFGGQITYLKRYAIAALLGLVVDSDEDGQNTGDYKPQANTKETKDNRVVTRIAQLKNIDEINKAIQNVSFELYESEILKQCTKILSNIAIDDSDTLQSWLTYIGIENRLEPLKTLLEEITEQQIQHEIDTQKQ